MNANLPGPANAGGVRPSGASWWKRWGVRRGSLLALLALVAGGWLWSRRAATRQARAWAEARPMASRENVFDAAKTHAARFGPGDWNYLMSAALDVDRGVAAWVARRRFQFPTWLQPWLPLPTREGWIDLELAWKSCPGKDAALRILVIQRAAEADATQAWRLMDLAMGEGEPLSLPVLEAAARVADVADFKVRLVVANGLARATPDARVAARRLLEGLRGDTNPMVAETARRVLERAPYR